MNPYRLIRRWLIARALRRMLPAYRIGRAESAQRSVTAGTSSGSVFFMAADGSFYEAEGGEVREVSPPKPKAEPGRQRIRMSSGAERSLFSLFGDVEAFRPLPRAVRTTRWEDCHDFGPVARRPSRDPIYGLQITEPPFALVCVECEVQQPPLQAGDRQCPYCGVRMRLHGSIVYSWREDAAPELEWKP